MAAAAQRDAEKRTVEVDRLKLIATLESNRVKHIQDYDESMEGYKSTLLVKIDQAFEKAMKNIPVHHKAMKDGIIALATEDIAKQNDYFTIVEEQSITMKVPRSYAKEYDAAIDMAKWDVRETLELTHAEFTCFVRDQWDWKSSFDAVSAIYKNNR